MIGVVINVGLLIWVASAHRKLKHDVLIALLFGTVKAAVILTFSIGLIEKVGFFPVAINAFVRGLFSFLTCWGFMALLGRTDRLDLEHRRAVAAGEHRKKPALVLEYIGIAVCGILAALS